MLEIRRRCRREHGGRKTFCFDVVGNVSKKHCGNRNVGRSTYDGSTYDSAPCLQKTYHRDFQDPRLELAKMWRVPPGSPPAPSGLLTSAIPALQSFHDPTRLSVNPRSHKSLSSGAFPCAEFFLEIYQPTRQLLSETTWEATKGGMWVPTHPE